MLPLSFSWQQQHAESISLVSLIKLFYLFISSDFQHSVRIDKTIFQYLESAAL